MKKSFISIIVIIISLFSVSLTEAGVSIGEGGNAEFRNSKNLNATAYNIDGGVMVENLQITDHWDICLDILNVSLKKDVDYKIDMEIYVNNPNGASIQFDFLDLGWNLIDAQKAYIFQRSVNLKTTIFLHSDREATARFAINLGDYANSFFVKSVKFTEFKAEDGFVGFGYGNNEIHPADTLIANFSDIVGLENGAYLYNPKNGNHWDLHFDLKNVEFTANQNYIIEAEIVSFVNNALIGIQILDDNQENWEMVDEKLSNVINGNNKVIAILKSTKTFVGRLALNFGANEGLYAIKSLKITEVNVVENQIMKDSIINLGVNAEFYSNIQASAQNMNEGTWIQILQAGREYDARLDLPLYFIENHIYQIDFNVFYNFKDKDDILIQIKDYDGNILQSKKFVINEGGTGAERFHLEYEALKNSEVKVSIFLGKRIAEYLVQNLDILDIYYY